MAGIITNEIDDDLLKIKDAPAAGEVATAGSVGYDASVRQVDPGKETVSGQLDSVLSKDSPVLQRARTSAAQQANARGLLNSSMGVQAGEAAVIGAALPIASADASVYGTASRDNQLATNQSRQFGAGEANTTTRLNAGAMNESGITALRGQIETQLQTLRGDQAENLANIEAGYRQLIQASSSASGFYSDTVKMIAAIMADTNTSVTQKQAAVNSMGSMLKSGLTVIGNIADLDLAGLLDFTNTAPAGG